MSHIDFKSGEKVIIAQQDLFNDADFQKVGVIVNKQQSAPSKYLVKFEDGSSNTLYGADLERHRS